MILECGRSVSLLLMAAGKSFFGSICCDKLFYWLMQRIIGRSANKYLEKWMPSGYNVSTALHFWAVDNMTERKTAAGDRHFR